MPREGVYGNPIHAAAVRNHAQHSSPTPIFRGHDQRTKTGRSSRSRSMSPLYERPEFNRSALMRRVGIRARYRDDINDEKVPSNKSVKPGEMERRSATSGSMERRMSSQSADAAFYY